MVLKDKFKNRITILQAKSGLILMVFANSSIVLDKQQVEALVGSNVYDIDGFDKEKYLSIYGS